MPFCDFDSIENEKEDLGFWDNVYGFDFSPIKFVISIIFRTRLFSI